MKFKSLTFVVLTFTLALAACAPNSVPAAKPAATSIPTKAVPTVTKPATKVMETTPTEQPTQSSKQPDSTTPVASAVNEIVVDAQKIVNGEVVVNRVIAEKAGWVAIFTDNDNKPGTLLGYSEVPAGKTEVVHVKVDSSKTTDKMIALLIVDKGTMGTFEYPGSDTAVTQSGSDVMAVFEKIKG